MPQKAGHCRNLHHHISIARRGKEEEEDDRRTRKCHDETNSDTDPQPCEDRTLLVPDSSSMSSRMLTRTSRRYVVFTTVVVMIIICSFKFNIPCTGYNPDKSYMVPVKKYMTGSDNKLYAYDKNMPIVFIGGMPRSGTTLIRALLDAHPQIRCGEETRVIPRVLNLKHMWSKSEVEATRLAEAGITTEVLDSALAAFILEIIARHGEPAPRLCNKDPFTLRSAIYLNGLFPNSKFVLMVRDGRAVVHSIISRKVTITGFNLSDYRQCLTKWNSAMQNMHTQCSKLGPELCIHVYYEQLVLHPRLWLERILTFLDVPWNDSVLHHDKLINKPGGVSLSKLEKSSDQVIKPINLDALTTWVGQMPDDVVADMHSIAPMLSVLGYDPHSNPPDYGKPDTFVVKNTNDINKNKQNWERKGDAYRINAKQLAKEKRLNKNKQKDASSSNQTRSTSH